MPVRARNCNEAQDNCNRKTKKSVAGHDALPLLMYQNKKIYTGYTFLYRKP